MRFAVLRFPGSNCDQDCLHALRSFDGATADYVWHKETHRSPASTPSSCPGGFSYGDYLRCGAIARFSPIMQRGEGIRRTRRARPRHLQRLPDSLRSRPAARRARPQPRPAFHLRARRRARRNDQLAVHKRRASRRDAAHPHRPRRRLLLRRRSHARANSRPNDQILSATATPAATSPTPPIPTARAKHRRHLQRARQRLRPDAPPRARLRPAPRQRRRPRHLRINS